MEPTLNLSVRGAAAGAQPDLFPVSTPATLIGRGPDNDLVLNDMTVSRRHARLLRQADGCVIENLSAPGRLRINGRSVECAPLADGDTIQLGESAMVFRLAAPRAETAEEMQPFITVDAHDGAALVGDVDDASLQNLRRARADLTALYQAGQVLNASLSTAELCDRTLELVLGAMQPVDCCSLHLLDAGSGELACRANRARAGSEADTVPHGFSRTLLDKVLHEMKGVLTFDAQDDGRFDLSRSIASLHIRSAMCVPIQVKGRLTGVLQAHTLSAAHTFTVQDLKLLTAFGMMAGVAIENAVLYERLEADRARQEERARLMQIMLHELKSPITGARMMADMLHRKLVPEEKQTDFQGRVVARLDNMLEWVKDTLNLSRIKAGDGQADAERLDLGACVDELAGSYREQADAKGIGFALDLPDTPVTVRIGARNLHLVISNLLSNAVKYTAAGRVTAAVEATDGRAVLRVSDSGIGIPAADLPKLFGEFFRAANARKANIPGSGVGLASVKCIVEAAGGTLSVESVEGRGTTFTADLPLASR